MIGDDQKYAKMTRKIIQVYKQAISKLDKAYYRTCSPNFAKLAERIDGETMISLFENLSTRDEALTTVETFLLDSQKKKVTKGYYSRLHYAFKYHKPYRINLC